VQLGSGGNNWDGWVNVDLSPSSHPDLVLDLRGGFPAAPVVRRAYSEHVLEHLDIEDGRRLLADLASALAPDGLVRIAMPDLDHLIDCYRGDWRDQAWLDDEAYAHIDSAARMLNYSLRSWGHKYVYGFDELALRLREAGFTQIERMAWGESDDPELRGRETRPDSLLVVEARR
jgi:predicted SAM-dependent methyltransferase